MRIKILNVCEMPVPVCIKCLVTSKYHYYYPFKTPLHLVSSHWGCFINISWGIVKAIAFQCEKVGGSPDRTGGKEPTCQCRRCKEMRVQSLGREDPLEEGTATHFSILAWRMPRTEEPGKLWSIGWQRVGHNWSNLACMQARTGSQALWSNMESRWTWREEYWAWTLKQWKWALCSVTQRRYIVWHYML